MPRFVIQGVGYLGLAAFVVSYQTRSNKKLYLIQLAGVLLFTLQFALLGAYSGCLSLALTAVRNSMLSKYGEWPWVRKKIWPVLLLLGFTAVLFFTWAGPASLLAWTASVVSTLCYWTNNACTLRAPCGEPFRQLALLARLRFYRGFVGRLRERSVHARFHSRFHRPLRLESAGRSAARKRRKMMRRRSFRRRAAV